MVGISEWWHVGQMGRCRADSLDGKHPGRMDGGQTGMVDGRETDLVDGRHTDVMDGTLT